VKKKYSETTFERKSFKYWIRLSDVTEVIAKIIPQLPIYRYKGKGPMSAPITSIYLDSTELQSFHSRLARHESSTLVRIRWYGGNKPGEEVFMERKQHHESWVQATSTKQRFQIPEKDVLQYLSVGLDGKVKVEAKEKQPLLIDIQDPLYHEIHDFVAEKKLRPMIRTQYLRAAFQLSEDNSVRISLDTQLAMHKENVHLSQEWYVPENRISEKDIHKFPFAVLEVKLQESSLAKRPEWISTLMSSPLLTHVEKFSKFGHGIATHYPTKIKIVPHWLSVGNKFEHMYTSPSSGGSITTIKLESDKDIAPKKRKRKRKRKRK